MTSPSDRLHANEVAVDAAVAARLIRRQFPQWTRHRLEVVVGGTSHWLFRLGRDLLLRLPRRPEAASEIVKEWYRLPRLAADLPLEAPVPIAQGSPDSGYPWPWAIYRWIEGEPASSSLTVDSSENAQLLASFLRALQCCDTAGGPPAGEHNSLRGAPLAAPSSSGAALWVHGDLLPGNLLLRERRLHAVIDFGLLGLGDPATDLLPAWSLFGVESRRQFRGAVQVDDACWARGRGWALWQGLTALSYYHDRHPVMARIARRAIHEVLTDPNGAA
jgi:aminoglycoside phosphotransferase (APT) family kinase protein